MVTIMTDEVKQSEVEQQPFDMEALIVRRNEIARMCREQGWSNSFVTIAAMQLMCIEAVRGDLQMVTHNLNLLIRAYKVAEAAHPVEQDEKDSKKIKGVLINNPNPETKH
jgi:hypothetical protein